MATIDEHGVTAQPRDLEAAVTSVVPPANTLGTWRLLNLYSELLDSAYAKSWNQASRATYKWLYAILLVVTNAVASLNRSTTPGDVFPPALFTGLALLHFIPSFLVAYRKETQDKHLWNEFTSSEGLAFVTYINALLLGYRLAGNESFEEYFLGSLTSQAALFVTCLVLSSIKSFGVSPDRELTIVELNKGLEPLLRDMRALENTAVSHYGKIDFEMLMADPNSVESIREALTYLSIRNRGIKKLINKWVPVVVAGNIPSREKNKFLRAIDALSIPTYLLGQASEALSFSVFFYLLILSVNTMPTTAFPSLSFMLYGTLIGMVTTVIGLVAGKYTLPTSRLNSLTSLKYVIPSGSFAFLSILAVYAIPVLPLDILSGLLNGKPLGIYEEDPGSIFNNPVAGALLAVLVLSLLPALVFFFHLTMKSYTAIDGAVREVYYLRKFSLEKLDAPVELTPQLTDAVDVILATDESETPALGNDSASSPSPRPDQQSRDGSPFKPINASSPRRPLHTWLDNNKRGGTPSPVRQSPVPQPVVESSELESAEANLVTQSSSPSPSPR